MQTNNKNVIEINLRDLLFDLLYRWRSLIAALLIGALLLGGYAWLSNQKSQEKAASVTVTSEEAEVKRLEEEKQLEEANRLPQEALETYKQLLDANVDYMENSVLMNTDPYREWQARAVYTVVSDAVSSEEKTGQQRSAVTIAAAYPSVIHFDWNQGKLQEIYGEKAAPYAAELFRCEAVEQSGTIVVSAIGLTEEMAKAGLDYLKSIVMDFCIGKGQSLGMHHLELLNEYSLQIIDPVAEEQQRNMYTLRAAYQTGITNSENAIRKPAPASTPQVKTKSVLSNAIIGGLIGLIGLLFIYFIRYVLCGKMQRCQVLQDHGVSIYGQFNHSRARHPGKGLDRLIEKLEFRNNQVARETVIENICSLLKEKSTGKILLTSSLPLAEIQSLCAEIHSKTKEDLDIQVEEDFLNNRSVIDAANQVQSIVLVEEKYVSNVKDIRRMAEVLTICETPVIGAIVL